MRAASVRSKCTRCQSSSESDRQPHALVSTGRRCRHVRAASGSRPRARAARRGAGAHCGSCDRPRPSPAACDRLCIQTHRRIDAVEAQQSCVCESDARDQSIRSHVHTRTARARMLRPFVFLNTPFCSACVGVCSTKRTSGACGEDNSTSCTRAAPPLRRRETHLLVCAATHTVRPMTSAISPSVDSKSSPRRHSNARVLEPFTRSFAHSQSHD